MADRGRDLKVSILSDVDEFDADEPARQLDKLAAAADDAGRNIDDLDRRVSRSKVERFGTDAKSTARKVDDAFDAIARSSKSSLKKVDDDLDRAGDGLNDFKDEAHQSGREAAASFSGGFDGIVDFVQETAANAFGGFGPIGAAAGIAAAAGIGIISKAFGDSKQKAEEAKEAVDSWIQGYIDGLGQIKEATIQSKLDEFAQEGGKRLRELSDEAKTAGVNVADFQRAMAGDAEAQQRVAQQYQEQIDKLRQINPLTDDNTAAHVNQQAALSDVAEELGLTNSQMAEGKRRADELREAANRPISVKVTTGIDIPSPRELDAINRRIRDGIGQIVIPVSPGQSRFENNANNSRYRW